MSQNKYTIRSTEVVFFPGTDWQAASGGRSDYIDGLEATDSLKIRSEIDCFSIVRMFCRVAYFGGIPIIQHPDIT